MTKRSKNPGTEHQATGTAVSEENRTLNLNFFWWGWDWVGGMGLWNRYPRETVKPSFEPQPPSLMLKMRFLRRSARNYEKSWSFGHGVGWNVAKIARWESEILRFFWQGKVRSTLVKKWKKISRWCVGGSGYHIKLDSSLFYLVGPDGPPKKRLSYVNFSLDFGNGIVLEIIVKL